MSGEKTVLVVGIVAVAAINQKDKKIRVMKRKEVLS
jgi:hypothetical protein